MNSQQINALDLLNYSDISGNAGNSTYLLASNIQSDSILNSKSMALSAIQENTVGIVRNLPEFNPTGKWTFEKGINLPDRTYTNALREELSSTLMPKKYLENDFMKLLNALSNEIYSTPHIPSAPGEIIFSTYCKTETKVKQIYGEYTSWRKIPGRFLLATTVDSSPSLASGKMQNTLKVSGVKGGEAMHTPTINEIPQHMHKFKCDSDSDTLELSESPSIIEDSIEDVFTKKDGSSAWFHTELQLNNCLRDPNPVPVKIDYYFRYDKSEHLYGNGNSAGAKIKESTLKNKAHSNMPPFYSVYIWERIK